MPGLTHSTPRKTAPASNQVGYGNFDSGRFESGMLFLLFNSRVGEVVGLNPRQSHRVAGDAEAHPHVADDDCQRDAYEP
jgi:hypothetical protein